MKLLFKVKQSIKLIGLLYDENVMLQLQTLIWNVEKKHEVSQKKIEILKLHFNFLRIWFVNINVVYLSKFIQLTLGSWQCCKPEVFAPPTAFKQLMLIYTLALKKKKIVL